MSDNHIDLEEQERVEILEEIDKLVATNRLPVSDAMEKLKPQKSGVGFPLVINLLAVAAVVSTFYFSNRMFEQKQESLSMENATYQSAEGKLLEELKRESAERLEQKDQEIGVIQKELEELDKQSRELAATMDQQIADRENELRLALEAELENERAKLRSQGKSEADIETELNRIESERSAEYEAELSAFREETEQAIAEKEEELARAKQINEELLAEVNAEKERIQDETLKRENELTARFEAEKAELAEEAASAQARLQQLTENQAKESLIIDQINGSYESIFNYIQAGNTTDALSAITALKQLIEDPAVAKLKAVNARSSNDQEMLNILRQRIEEQAYKDNTDTKSLAAAADLLLSAQEIAALGTEAYNIGNTTAAEEYYTRSLSKIPAIKQAWENLERISRDAEAERLSEIIREGNELASAGDQLAASRQFATAAGSAYSLNPELLRQAVAGMLDSSDTYSTNRIAQKDSAIKSLEIESSTEIGKLESSLEEMKAGYESELAAAKAQNEATIEQTVTEYENKLAAAEAEYQSALEKAETEYETLLADADVSASELETSKDEEIDRLTRLIGERDQENLNINAEKTGIEEALAAAEEVIAEKTAELEQYRLDSAEEMGTLNTMASEEIKRLEKELDASVLRYTELEETYKNEQIVASNRLKASEMTGYTNGIRQGRKEALEDILYFSSYLEGSAAYDPEAQTRISELVNEDPVYSETVQKIQNIAAAGGTETEGTLIPVARNILIGTISFASGDEIIIEPLTDQMVESGARVMVYRKERGRDETYITFGIVTSATENRIKARTDPAGTAPAQSMDLVYMTVTD